MACGGDEGEKENEGEQIILLFRLRRLNDFYFTSLQRFHICMKNLQNVCCETKLRDDWWLNL